MYLISICTGATEGDPFWDGIRDAILGEPSKEIQDCQNPKPILLSTGEVRTSYNQKKQMSRPLSINPSSRHNLFSDELATPMAPRNSGCTDYHYWISGHSGSPRRSEVSREKHPNIRFVLTSKGMPSVHFVPCLLLYFLVLCQEEGSDRQSNRWENVDIQPNKH